MRSFVSLWYTGVILYWCISRATLSPEVAVFVICFENGLYDRFY